MKNSKPNYVTLDTETTIKNKGHPFTPGNKLCWVGLLDWEGYHEYPIEYQDEPYGPHLLEIKSRIDAADLLIGFNIKFDLHWLRKYINGIEFRSVYDCQLAEFILGLQQEALPSLDAVADRRGLGRKLDRVRTEYWERGIDTPDVPRDILSEYAELDVRLTEQIFARQRLEFRERPRLRRMFNLQCEDLLVLEEMEWNGIVYDTAKAAERGLEVQQQLDKVLVSLDQYVGGNVDRTVNWGSPDHVSAVLYGGSIKEKYREQYTRTLKSGEVKQKERWSVREVEFPRLVDPLKPDNLSVAEPVLKRLKPKGDARKILKLLDERARLARLDSMYYTGLIDKYKEMGWSGNIFHGNFNQSIARTGRLSSSNPNLQNFDGSIKELFYSRFGDDGVLINGDWKGLEWVAAVYLSGDGVGRAEIHAGVDQHSDNQRRLGLPSGDIGRLLAKVFVFRLIYGGSAFAYANDAQFDGVSSKESFWQDVIDRFYAKYNGLREWHEWLVEEAMRCGVIQLPTGRGFAFTPNPATMRWPRTTILNYPVQGLAADWMVLARVLLWRKWQQAVSSNLICKAVLVSTVHDSILVDSPKSEAGVIVNLMKEVWAEIPAYFEKYFGVPLDLPVRVEIKQGPNWKDQQEV